MIWWLRWRAANVFMRLAFKAMPPSATRELYVEAVKIVSRHIIEVVEEHRAKASAPSTRTHTD